MINNKKPNSTAQSYAAYIQEGKNSTSNTNTTSNNNKSVAERFAEIYRGDDEQQEKLKTSLDLLNLRMSIGSTQFGAMSASLDEIIPDEIRFLNALDPTLGMTPPKRTSYEEAQKVFDAYDEVVRNPITTREYLDLKKRDPNNDIFKLGASYTATQEALDDYVIFNSPEDEGYINPNKSNALLDFTASQFHTSKEAAYNAKLMAKTLEYSSAMSRKIDLENTVNTAWESYFKNLTVEPEVYESTWGKWWRPSMHILSLGIVDSYDTHRKEKNAEYKRQAGLEREEKTYTTLGEFYNRGERSLKLSKYDKFDPIIHGSNVAYEILETLPKDNTGNIFINGQSFPEYFVYKQLFNITTGTFENALINDGEINAHGLGREFLNEFYSKQYGKTYDEILLDTYRKRIPEIKKEIIKLRDEAVKELAPEVSNKTHAGMNTMGTMLPSSIERGISDWTAETAIAQPFDDVIESLDATMASIEGGDFIAGFKEGFDFSNLISFSLNEIGINLSKMGILDKVDKGQTLSKGETYLYELYKYEKELEGLYKNLDIEKSTWGEIGSGVGGFVADIPTFAAGMGLTSGIGAGVRYGTRFALKKYLTKKSFQTAANLVRTSTVDFAKFYGISKVRGMAAAPITHFAYRSYTEKALDQYSFDESGNLVFTPKNKWAMATAAYIEGANEIASESWGGVFGDAISLGAKSFGRAVGITKLLNKTRVGAVTERALQSPTWTASRHALSQMGYQGLGEAPSEAWGDIMSQTELMLLDNSVNFIQNGTNFEWKKEGRDFDTGYSFEQFKDPDYWITIMGISAISGGGMSIIPAAGSIITEAHYIKQIKNKRNEALENINNEELKNALEILGNSENFVDAAIELADFDWDSFTSADKSYALNYMRLSHILNATTGDMEGQRHMMAFEETVDYYNQRVFSSEGKRTGRIYTAVDNQSNQYNVLSVEELNEDGSVKSWRVIDDNGNTTIKPDSELHIFQEESIDDILSEEYRNMFSPEIEAARLNTIRQAFEQISNPTEKDVRRITSEFGIRKPEVGKTVTLVDGTEATIKEDLKNGNYIIERNNPETVELEEVEIPVHSILSNNPITAAAQEKMFEDAQAAYESGNPSVAQEVYKSPEEKVDDIINRDYDSRLFSQSGAIKLTPEQVVANFSFENPNTLEDYIKKIGNRVPPETKQALNKALEISKKYNEISTHIADAVQQRAVTSNVTDLVNSLREVTKTATPQTTAEELIIAIIDNPNTPGTVREDFQNILKNIKTESTNRQATVKIDTSKTQESLEGKRGRKQVKKGLADLEKAKKNNNPIETLNAINWIDETLSRTEEEPITEEERQTVEEARKSLKEQGYEIASMRGTTYHEGMKVIATFKENPELPAGTQTIIAVKKPQINKDGAMVQAAEIVVEQGPPIEEETPDISQVESKEMIAEKPIDLSEPAEDKVTLKKEDSIPQEFTEQEFSITALDNAFAMPDSDKLIETPSREDEVETLTDEQRGEVRIHNEQSTDLVDYISDSVLPDDQRTDEVIVDEHELQGNRIYRYNGEQLRNDQKQIERTPNKEGDAHDLLYKWLDENNIDLQGIIDNELAAIAALDTDVRFMMMTESTKSGYSTGSPMLNTVFQVVEYTDAIKKIHNEKRGGVITSNGKEYLLIGITGFSTPKPGVFNPEAAHYNFLADKVLKPARNNYVSQTDEISREAYYIHPSMSTKIKEIQAGWIVTQTTEDLNKQNRSLGKLFEDESRNPHGINVKNSKWLVPTRNSAKPIKVRIEANDVVHGLKIPTGLAGGLFLLVPAANGHYIPISVKIQTTNELVDGKLKDIIWNTAQGLLDNSPEVREHSIKELCKLLNLTKEGYNIFIDDSEIDFDSPNNAKIVFTSNGVRMPLEISLNSSNTSAELYNTIFSKIPFQLNVGLQTLVTPSELELYIESGALVTDAALLGTTNASYTIHSVGADLKADPYQENSTSSQEGSYENSDLRRANSNNGIINYSNNSYFRYTEGQYVNTKTGALVTDSKTIREIETHIWLEKTNPNPIKIEKNSKSKLYIVGENEVISVSEKGIITFFSPERSSKIIEEVNREVLEEVREINAKEELARVEEQQQEAQAVVQELQEEQDASVPEVNFNEDFDMYNSQEGSPIEDSFTEVPLDETSSLTETVSGTFTEGVVENTDSSQLSTFDYLSTIEEQFKSEGLSEEEIDTIMEKVFTQLEESGMATYYTKEQESKIKSIIDNIKNCH